MAQRRAKAAAAQAAGKLEGGQELEYDHGTYEGQVGEDGEPHGYGTHTHATTSETHRGQWQSGKRHGYGVCELEGDTYAGQYSDNYRHGKGIYQYKKAQAGEVNDLDRYEGDFVEDEFCGKGVLIAGNGDRYEGEMKNYCKHGRGKVVMQDGIYDGEFINDERSGYGVHTWTDGEVQEGIWKNDVRNGPGKWTLKNEGTFEGTFKDGAAHGLGTFKWTNGDSYTGNWVRCKQKGHCEKWYRNGKSEANRGTYTGEVDQVKLKGKVGAYTTAFHGRGTLRDAQGQVVVKTGVRQEGEWCEDELVKSFPVEKKRGPKRR